MTREYSLTAALLGAGVENLERAKLVLTGVLQACEGADIPSLVKKLAKVADPDLALLSLSRILEEDGRHARKARRALCEHIVAQRTLRLLGASEFFGNYLVTHSDILAELEIDPQPVEFARIMLQSVGAVNLGTEENPCWVAAPDADVLVLRRAYYRLMARIVAADLAAEGVEGAKASFEKTAAAITDLVDATLEAGLALSRREHDPDGNVAFAVIAMGKTGARELNYISDVDVIYVSQAAPTAGISSEEATRVGTQLALTLGNLCSSSMREPALWTVDASLRPEGKDGVLVRPLESHIEYYSRWAKAWEFQALLKARPAAGDRELGVAYLEALQPGVWKVSEREGFVEETRAMRRRVEKLLEPGKAGREIKLGVGGLRDVEFTVQLLQLVHGRVDKSLRVQSTLAAIKVLVDGGYIARDQGEYMADHYRFLRVVEHRTQLYRMRRTHLFPQGLELRRVGRSIDPSRFGDREGQMLTKTWHEVRSQVRGLHEEIYYRPLLPATARLSVKEAALALDSQAAISRLCAIGYRDPKRAVGHIEALATGVTRRAAIQRQLLPVLLGWFAAGVDPDGGLLAFRQVSEALGETHWYLHLLRDSGTAAQNLTQVLSSSPLVAALLPANPEAVQWLDAETELRAKTRQELETELVASFERQPDLGKREIRLRALRGRELLRAAMGDVLHGIEALRGAAALTAVGEAVLAGALDLALDRVAPLLTTGDVTPQPEPLTSPGGIPVLTPAKKTLRSSGQYADYLIVAMGRLGGGETGYATDADVVFFYDTFAGVEAGQAAVEAKSVVAELTKILGGAGGGAWVVDTSLRPEGKAGAPARELGGYKEYLERWAATWERQALLRARPIVGAEDLQQRYIQIIAPYRYEHSPSDKELVEIRRLKARMENERAGAGGGQVGRQVKLGAGGLSDVEWTVQTLQLLHATAVPGLRVTGTREAMQAAWQAGLLTAQQIRALDAAWMLATRIRVANVLGSGRTSGKKLDEVPTGRALEIVAALLGYAEGSHNDLVEDWMRVSRQARSVVETVFYGWDC